MDTAVDEKFENNLQDLAAHKVQDAHQRRAQQDVIDALKEHQCSIIF